MVIAYNRFGASLIKYWTENNVNVICYLIPKLCSNLIILITAIKTNKQKNNP